MPSAGPSTFTTPILRRGFWLNGRFFQGKASYPGRTSFAIDVPATRLLTLARTEILQLTWLAGDSPVNLEPVAAELELLLTHELDYDNLMAIAHRGVAVSAYFDLWLFDQWFIVGNAGTATTWRSSRYTPWNVVPGIDQSTRIPEAYTETAAGVQTPLTVVAASPIAGQIAITDTGGAFQDFETGDDSDTLAATEEWLVVKYPPILIVTIEVLRVDFVQNNEIRMGITIREQPAGVYTAGVVPTLQGP